MNHTLRLGLFGIVVFALGAWVAFILPTVFAKHIQNEVLNRTGHILTVLGGASLQIVPQFGVALRDVAFVGNSGQGTPLMKAKSLSVPLTFMQAIGADGIINHIDLVAPIFNLDFNRDGQSEFAVKTAAAGKSDAHTPLPEPLDITFSDGLFNYHDETTATAFALREMVGSFEIDEQNEIFFQSSATLNEQRVHFSGNLKSLPRALGDGSPLDLNMEGAGASFGFSGRVVARQSLELAGTGSIDTQDSARLFKWFGFDLHGLRDKNSLWVESAVDSSGPLFLLKNAVIHFGKANAKGDVSYSGAGAKPRVTLAVDVDRLDLNSYTINPKKSAAAQNWNENIFDLHDLNAVDLQFRVTANQLLYEKLQIPTAQVEGQLNDGVLNAHIGSVQFGKIELNFDAKQIPPKLDLILALEHLEAGTFLSSIAGMNWLSGNMQLNASLSAKGTSQAEMMGNLAGTADVKGESFAIHGADLAGLATRALAEPVSGWGSGDFGPVTAKAKFSISDGIATVSENSLSGASIKLSQTGEIDILRKALNLEAVVGLNGADHKSNKVEISGPWANPRFSVAQ